ncbi:CarboxypepD_reg-like domain-containing protein [Hymenobacter gelipurpurascens]|uniref:CarboxypepD_reg-like domain-containing protein n=1 Tax=Hymenobacter gelipurpurascens TaxID=89968 RepID=A0A212TER3_9BACT|nr:carboxypeptidase-like regulatory domain-containing protein [Hymenobacter gelipurpurascens]SNC64519.1 CarboxypepD_reg-like domain-containing protein [Hymenobacter gelipurpurascens]
MNENTTTPVENEELTPELMQEEEENLSSGNRRLGIIVGTIVLVVGMGYALLPAKATEQIINVMPSMELGSATVTASRPTDEAPQAATVVAEEEVEEEKEAPKTAAELKVAAAAKAAAAREAAKRTVAPVAPEIATSEVEVEPVPAAVVAEPAAPTTVTISGRILNENGRPMAGATVLLKGSKKAVGTDANGNYTMEVPAGDNTLVYGYGGYQDQEMRARGAQPLNVTLIPDENAGKRRRR